MGNRFNWANATTGVQDQMEVPLIFTASQKSKLLAVDDSAINLITLLALLGENYDLRVASDGEAALSLIASDFLPDLILLDIMMPGMDGYEVCRRLKSDKATQHIPIIFLTSLDNEEDESKGLELGAVDYITKPFNPAIMRQRVQIQLELKRNRDQLQELVAEKTQKLRIAHTETAKSEASVQSILKSAPVGIGLIVDRKLQWINQRMEEMVGYTSAELEGKSARVLYQSADKFDWVGKEKYAQISQHGTGSVDTQFITKEGSVIDVFLNSTPLDSNDLSVGVIFTALDITERKKAESSIIKAKEEWETTFDAMADMVTIHDRNMLIVRANKSAHDFFGAALGGLNGKTCCEAFWDSDITCPDCPLQKTVKNGEQCSEILSHNLSNKTLQVTTVPIPVEHGQVEYFIHVARDISAQQQLEKEANRASRLASLGELAAGVAHEINNPNALILYNSDILDAVIKDLLHFLEKNPPADSAQLFGGLPYRDALSEIPILLPSIHDSAQRIKRIVNDLRDFSRQDSSASDEAVDLNQVVHSSVRLVNNAIKKATDYFTQDLAKTLPAVRGVAGRLDQVVINLLLNACQALENRSQTISISTDYDVNMEQVRVVVVDAGCGMTAAVLEHIFEPFVTTKRKQGGTGLGLSVSARIIKEHHGELKFTSVPGDGTRATISLPVCKEGKHVN
ncbi:MAG: PAS domain S-box protein [Desulfuromusa sp.]|jgi:PAS domain S-box-containing protein|nr:PAS domain S-box protein [Desulfuromusa sp.]